MPRKIKKEFLNLYGLWIERIIHYLGPKQVNRNRLAKHAGLNPGTLSNSTRPGIFASRENVKRILKAAHEIAQEQGRDFSPWVDEQVLHSAGHASDDDIEAARENLCNYDMFPLE